jgi:hypothetical protein
MRRYQYKKILDLLNTIEEAQSAKLYADCQECAIVIGEYIEDIVGEGTQTVTMLEEYCELLYKASIGEAGQNALKKYLPKIINNVKFELKPTKIEIAFICYRASMSDSLESIYRAAKADPCCDAYWIPVPYHECNPDGSRGLMHYEGKEFYKPDIECTDWREYIIEERRPDVIYTFSAYDIFNKMTIIHPDYYCERLRNLTDLLVFVPYFVAVDKIGEPFTTCAGVLFSHLVIVQSEQIRQDFIRDYKEIEALGYSRGIYGAPEQKIVALGSPKFDAVLNAKPEDFAIPKAWRKLIMQQEGAKKIILLNTSINTALNSRERYLKKLRYIHGTFRNRKNIVLWWRPHPLGRVAFSSMFPELVSEYDKIVADYKNEGWGIYDDTPDMHRAIACTDAYYGDWSSLIPLYQMTGKPIMIGDPNIHDGSVPFEPVGIYISEDKLRFVIRRFNALISMDRNTWATELAGSFPDEADYIEEFNNSFYRNPVEVNGVLYFPPFLANEIVIYSTQTETFEKLKYKDDKENEKVTRDFLGAVAYGDFVFFVPYEYPAIVQLNTKTMEITFHSDWVESLIKLKGDVEVCYCGYPLVIDSIVWLPVLEANIMMEFNMETCGHTFHEVGEKDYRYSGSYFDGVHFWLSPYLETRTPVVKWNPDTGVTTYFPDIYVDGKDCIFSPLFFYSGYIWLLPMTGEHAVKIDTATDSVSIASEFESGPADNENGQTLYKYMFAQSYGDSIYAFIYHTKTLVEYNLATGVRKEEVIRYSPEVSIQLERLFSGEFIKDIEKINTAHDYYYVESNLYRLNGFITYIERDYGEEEKTQCDRRKDVAHSITVNADGTAGKKIHDYVKNSI